MSVLRVLTVDDEMLALKRLKLLLQAIPYVEHVGEASSCGEALSEIATLSPDAVLLDIKMRDGDGFDVVEALAERPNPPAIIFITAFDHYAVRAFESAVADYLLKPVERERLTRALRKVRQELRSADAEQRLSEMQEIVRNLRSLSAGRRAKPFETEFWLRGSAGLVRVPIDVIDCDLGQTARTTQGRAGFAELVSRVTLGDVGIVFSYDVTRLSRNCSDWYQLLDLCGFRR